MKTIKIKKDTVLMVLTKTNRSLSDLSRELEMSPSYLTKLLAGDKNPSPKFRDKLMKAMDITVWDDLFTMTGE